MLIADVNVILHDILRWILIACLNRVNMYCDSLWFFEKAHAHVAGISSWLDSDTWILIAGVTVQLV